MSVAALVVKCVMVKRGAELISPSLLANIPKRSKECHEWFRLDFGDWKESSDGSSTEMRRLSRMRQRKSLSLVWQRKARKIDGNLWTKQRKQLFRKCLY